ncbi:MAG: DNA internalization-related competence protein ComEC/Rec2 [Candidatus Omnitrophota bacterium]
MKNPFAGIAIAVCSGILIGSSINIPFFYVYLSLLMLFFLTFMLMKRKLSSSILIGLILLLLGIVRWQVFISKSPAHIKNFVKESASYCTLTGEVINDPVIKKYDKEWKTTFVVRAHSVKRHGVLDKTEGLIYAALTDTVPYLVEYGDVIELKGFLSEPPAATNPGVFDFKKQLLQSDIYAMLKIKGNLSIRKKFVSQYSSFMRSLYRLKHRISSSIDAYVPSEHAAILKAMLLGERQDIPYSVNDSFIRTGTIHILSISGMHVGLFIFLVMLLLNVVRIPRLPRYLLTICILICYAMITGLAPPIVRATIMGIVILWGFILKRNPNIYNSLGLACLIMLFYNPAQIFNIGFQLSFISLISVLYIPSKIRIEKLQQKHITPFVRNLLKTVMMSCSAWVGTAPLIAYYFNILSPVTVLANLLVVPMLGIVLACGIAFVICGFISSHLGFILAQALWPILWFLKMVVTGFEKVPFAYAYVGTPSVIWIIIYYVFLLSVLNYKKIPIKPSRIIIAALIVINIFVYTSVVGKKRGVFEITFLDVGDGDAIYMRFPDGKNMLVDTGMGKDVDAGRSIVVPFLLHKGISRLDYIVLTHSHDDHIGGLKSIMAYLKIGRVFNNGVYATTQEMRNYKALLLKKGIGVEALYQGEAIKISDTVNIFVLHPPRNNTESGFYKDSNDSSTVLKVVYKNFSILLSGDIEEDALNYVMRQGSFIKADVLKIPHHGKRMSPVSLQFIKQVTPEIVLISRAKGQKDSAGLAQIIDEQSGKIALYTTDKQGAITITSNGTTYSICHFK